MKTNIATLLIAVSCFLTLEAEAQIIFEKVDSHSPFTEMISEIELIPLEADSVNMLRTKYGASTATARFPNSQYIQQVRKSL